MISLQRCSEQIMVLGQRLIVAANPPGFAEFHEEITEKQQKAVLLSRRIRLQAVL